VVKRNYKQELWLYLLDSTIKNPERLYDEYRFHPTRKWRFDYAIPAKKIAIEYEGQPYRIAKGGHNTIKGFQSNCEKYNEATLLGWKVLRFTAKMIENGTAFKQLDKLKELE
jgi:very-short-patch-repair endonuclease